MFSPGAILGVAASLVLGMAAGAAALFVSTSTPAAVSAPPAPLNQQQAAGIPAGGSSTPTAAPKEAVASPADTPAPDGGD